MYSRHRTVWVLGTLLLTALALGGCANRLGGTVADALPLARRDWQAATAPAALGSLPHGEFVRTRLGPAAGTARSPWVRTAEEAGQAGAAGGGGTDLAAAAQNPIATNISVPFESNFQFGSGPDDETGFVLNIQPVVPVDIGGVNLITRPIFPVMFLPGAVTGLPQIGGEAEGFGDTWGLGDINITSFLSPQDSGPITWGFGPSLTIPSATDDVLGSGKWSLGPSFVALTIKKPWLVGILLRHQWSFAGASDRSAVDQSVIQPFANFNLDDGWYLVTAPIFVANWQASSSERWVVPVGGGVGKLLKIGKQPINVNLHAYYNLERPENAPDWQIRFAVQLIFPKK
jgi:hypothetical protein